MRASRRVLLAQSSAPKFRHISARPKPGTMPIEASGQALRSQRVRQGRLAKAHLVLRYACRVSNELNRSRCLQRMLTSSCTVSSAGNSVCVPRELDRLVHRKVGQALMQIVKHC